MTAISVAALAACGDDAGGGPTEAGSDPAVTSSGPAATSTGDGGPVCSEVWVEGAELPEGYRGCDEAGTYVARDALGCSSGQRMVRYDDHYYAVLGGTIHQTESSLGEDVGYRKAVASCRG